MGEIFANRYELMEPIGEGATGSVWVARDLDQGELVAAKILRQSDAASLMRFVREQSMRVKHPHVVAPLDWAGSNHAVLFTMPLVDGGSISTLMGDYGPIPPLFVAELMRQSVDALASVHAAGIVHRDVKPANLLLAATGSGRPWVYLSDFSISLDLTGPRLTATGLALGTPDYMAPEVRAGSGGDQAGDIYALGVVAREMLLGHRDPAPGELERAAPPPLAQLIESMVQPSPGMRPTAAQVREVLADPRLAWSDDARGDIEVFRHVAVDAYPAETPTNPAPAAALAPAGGAGTQAAAPTPDGGGAPLWAWLLMVLMAFAAGYLVVLLFRQ